MKKYILFILTVIYNTFTFGQSNDLVSFYNKSDDFFGKYVKNGMVNYADLKENNSALQELIDLSNQIDVEVSDEYNYKAFWINVYNLGVIHAIVEKYPVTSPQEIPGFFVDNKYMLGGKLTTFNIIENEYLRGNFDEPRFHFVLVCGAVSCPPIVDYAYRPSMLDLQLDAQTRTAMNNEEFIQVDKANNKVAFSKIFSWYAKDFKGTGLSNIEYANKYRKEKIPTSYKSSFYEYNWTLNDSKGNWIEQSSEQKLSNIQAFTPSKLLQKGQWDFKLFNNLYTQTHQADADGKRFATGFRESFMTTTLEVTHGISKSGRINIGAVIGVRSSSKTVDGLSDVFSFKNENSTDSTFLRAGFTSFAPIIKVSPFKNISNFSFQTSLSIPLFGDVTDETNSAYGYLDKKSYVWDTKFFFDKSFGQDKFQAFAEVDFNYSFGEDSKEVATDNSKNGGERFANESLGIPVSLFLSYFPSDKFTVYINGQKYWLIDLGNTYSQNFTQVGFGLKYQATSKLNIEVSHGQFIQGANYAGLGQTYNLGLRYIL